MDSYFIMLNAPKESDTGRVLTIDSDGAERIYSGDEWNKLDESTLARIAQTKNIYVEKTVDDDDANELDDYYDLVNQGANQSDLDCFWMNANDTSYEIYYYECVVNRNDADALLKYFPGDHYWYRIW